MICTECKKEFEGNQIKQDYIESGCVCFSCHCTAVIELLNPI